MLFIYFFSWGMGSNGQLGQSDEEDLWEPGTMLGKQLEQRKVMAVSGGGQHTVLIAQGTFLFVCFNDLLISEDSAPADGITQLS
jgi:alpha-tubulin suppressor-like RCC1 family protein